jgi:hypothetical protein
LKRWHNLSGEPPKLLHELVARHTFGPVKDDVFQTGVFVLKVVQKVHELG